MLAKQPQDRPSDAAKVADLLRNIDATTTARPLRPIKRKRSYASAIGGAVSIILLGAIAAAAWWTSHQPPPEAKPKAESAKPRIASSSPLPTAYSLLSDDALIRQGQWTTRTNMIEGTGIDSPLVMRHPITGDARVRIRLSLESIKGTIASLYLDDRSRFCFDGRGSVLYVKGPVFGKSRIAKVGKSQHYLQPNVPFVLEMLRSEGTLSITIDGREVYRGPDDRLGLGTLSLRPHRNVMRVYEWSVVKQ